MDRIQPIHFFSVNAGASRVIDRDLDDLLPHPEQTRGDLGISAEAAGRDPDISEKFARNDFNLTSTNIVDFEGIYFRNPLVSLHVDSQKCFVVTE